MQLTTNVTTEMRLEEVQKQRATISEVMHDLRKRMEELNTEESNLLKQLTKG